MATDLSTTELIKFLKEAKTLDQAIGEIHPSISLTDHLRALLERSGMSVKNLSGRLLASRIFIYQILEGDRKPSRDMLLRIALVFRLSLDETQRLLKIAQRSALYPRIRRESVVIFALQRNYTLDEADAALRYSGEQPLLPERDRGLSQ